MMWGNDADKHEFGALCPLWYAEDHSARDRKKAVKRFIPLVNRGYAPAQCALAMAYFDGAGVRRDYPLCYRHFLASAEQGYPSAECMIGNFYATVKPRYDVCQYDPARGVQWWRRAAENGNAGAQLNLATACSTDNGLDEDNLEAFVWACLAVHCSAIRFRQAEVLRDQVESKLDVTQRAYADARVSDLKAVLPFPWSDHLRYWMSLAQEVGILTSSKKAE